MATAIATAVSPVPSNIEADHQVKNGPESVPSETDQSVPVIDYSKLTSSDPQERSAAIKDLEIACREWGGFLVINHGVPDSVMKALFEGYKKFFDLPLEDKLVYSQKAMWQPITFSTNANQSSDGAYQRSWLKTWVAPEFNFPTKPEGNSEIVREFYTRTQVVFTELMRGISETLGLEKYYFEKLLNLDPGCTMLIGNMYPPFPQQDKPIGIPAHTDPNLLTMLIENEIGGLQLLHNDQWVDANLPPNSFVINLGDQFEILTNGKYKSLEHRAFVNNTTTRMSVVFASGPTLDTVVSPAKELLEKDGTSPAYKSMTLKEYLEMAMRTPNVREKVRI